MTRNVDFSSQSKRKFVNIDDLPVRMLVDPAKFELRHDRNNQAVIKSCRTSEITKVLLKKRGRFYWLHVYFDDGQLIELRTIYDFDVANEMSEIQHQIRLLASDAKKREKAESKVFSEAKLVQSVNSLLAAKVISEVQAQEMLEAIGQINP